MDSDKKVIKSGLEFMNVLGKAIIALGIITCVVLLLNFDWGAYNEAQSVFNDEPNLLEAEMRSTVTLAFVSVISSIVLGALFIAIDRIALTLKKIQLGVKDDD